MAIVTPTGGILIPQVDGTTMIAKGGQDQAVATTANNNRKKMRGGTVRSASSVNAGTSQSWSAVSVQFQTLDQVIRWLDATFDALPQV